MKTSSQNFYVESSRPSNIITPIPTPTPSGGTTNKKPDEKPTEPPAERSDFVFMDIPQQAWFYEDVKWAYEEGLMLGTSEVRFSPEVNISQATVVTVLARLAGIDLTAYDGVTDPDVEPGMWYSAAAIWAKRIGLLPDGTRFTGEATISRNGMAVMLVKYLTSMGVDTTVGTDIAFDDMDQMTEDGQNAFRVLCHYGIFKGMGDNKMNPNGITTRAQFAALLHRISDFVVS